MRRLRIVSAVSAILIGIALAASLHGALRTAIALQCIVVFQQLWSLEMLRTIATNREIRG